jgi:peptidoglycan/xylan/chitin deacetylase (PgdA/CDA1 family)
MSNQVEVVMTFDDGPHVATSSNKTRNVINLLEERGIIGVFFILTHDRDAKANAYCRGKHPEGKKVVKEAIDAGHLVGIHTGEDGKRTHDRDHPTRYSQGWLDEDLVQAKDFINERAGGGDHCKFVRGPYGHTNDDCNSVYDQQDLQYVHWDVDPRDRAGRDFEDVKADLQNGITSQVNGGKRELVILFHDIQDHAGYRLAELIQAIEAAITSCGKTPDLTLSKSRTEQILTDQSSEN